MTSPVPEIIGVWIAAFLTLAIFSFLYKDNPIYKFAEHLYVGISVGYAFILALKSTLIPNLYEKVKVAALAAFGTGPEGATWGLFRLGAFVLGVMLLARLSRKGAWISRWPLALMIGSFAALRMTGLTQSDLIGQVNGTMVALNGWGLPMWSWEQPSVVNNLVLVVGVMCVLVYFFFSVEQKGLGKHAAGIGTVFLMVTFGSSFGYTVLGRVSLLIGRAQDLYTYSERRYGYATFICGAAVLLYLIVWERRRARARPGSGEPT